MEPDQAILAHDTNLSDELEHWLEDDDAPKTLSSLGDIFGEKSFAVTILVLMLLPALPAPTGGLTHIFEALTVLLAAQLVLGRTTIWLPERWRQRELGPIITGKAVPFIVRRVRWFERFSRPRGAALFARRWFLGLLGVVLITFAIASAVAPPFSGLDTLPALGAVVIALAIILEDVAMLGVGLAIGVAGGVLILTLGAAIARALQGLF